MSITKIYNKLKSEGIKASKATIDQYLSLLQDAFLFYEAHRYDIKGKEYLSTNAKYYTIDSGLRNAVIGKYQSDRGSQLENIVYLELKRRGYTVFVGKYDTKEIDFVAEKEGTIIYYQVAYQMPEYSKRETDNLIHIPDGYEKILITGYYPEAEMIDGVKTKYIVDFLLEEN